MKQDYDFRFNPAEPSDEQVRQHMDFDALLQKATRKPATKRVGLHWPYLGAAVAAGMVGAMLFGTLWQSGGSSGDYEQLAAAYFQAQPHINPPLKPMELPFVQVSLDAAKGGSINVNPRMKVNIPPSALALPDGKAAKGQVTIKYRKMKDLCGGFMSGIPMTYDSLGQGYAFSPQNLLEIYAEQNGQALRLLPESNMEVRLKTLEMAAASQNRSLAVYYLDEKARNWVYQGQSKARWVQEARQDLPQGVDEAAIEAKYQQEWAEWEATQTTERQALERQFAAPAMPKAPQRYNPNLPTFDFDFELDAADAYAQYQGLEWQVKEDGTLMKQIAQTEWSEDEISVQPLGDGQYRIRFDNGKQQHTLNATAVLSGDEYQKAISLYEQKKEQLRQQKERNAQQLRVALQALEAESQQKRAALQAEKNRHLNRIRLQQPNSSALLEKVVEHLFTIHQLGVWNCEAGVQPQGEPLVVECYDENGKPFKQTTLYVAQLKDHSLRKYYLGTEAQIHWRKDSPMQMWLVTDEGRIAVAYPKELEGMNPSGKTVRVTLKTIPEVPKREQDVYHALQLPQEM